MYRHFIYLTIILFASISINGTIYIKQNHTLVVNSDSLNLQTGDSLYQKATDMLIKGKLDSVRYYCQNAQMALKTTTQADLIMGKIYYLRGVIAYQQNTLQESKICLTAALHRLEKYEEQIKKSTTKPMQMVTKLKQRVSNALIVVGQKMNPQVVPRYLKKVAQDRTKITASIALNLALAQISNKRVDSVRYFSRLAQDLLKQDLQLPASERIRLNKTILHNLGLAYFIEQNYPMAANYFRQSLASLSETAPKIQSLYLANHLKLGETSIELKQWQEAKQHLNLVLNQSQNSSPDFVYLQAWIAYAKVLKHQAQSKSGYQLVLSHYRKANHLIRRLLRKQSWYKDRLDFGRLVKKMYDDALTLSYQLHRRFQVPEFTQGFFYFLSQKKAIVLSESLPNTSRQQYASQEILFNPQDQKVVDSLLLFEKFPSPSEAFLNYHTQHRLPFVYQVNNTSQVLRDTSNKVANLKSTQSKLGASTAMIAYTFTNNQLYGIGITKQRVFIKQWDKGQVQKIKTWIKAHNKYLWDDYEQVEKLTDTGSALYHMLLKPFNSILQTKPRLVLMPEGDLWSLIFETLPTHHCNDCTSQKVPYLVLSHIVSYHYTPQLWSQSSAPKKFTKRFVGFAPGFDDLSLTQRKQAPDLVAIPESIAEVKAAAHLLQTNDVFPDKSSGSTFTRKQASIRHLLQTLSTGCQVLHLATHSTDYKTVLPLSHISFYPTAPEIKYRLFLHDIYRLPPNAELVVLSSCSSGSGSLHFTEGPISLARGFIQAGFPRVIFSLRKIEDQNAQQMMRWFYQTLTPQPHDYAAALQKAKIHHMKQQLKKHLLGSKNNNFDPNASHAFFAKDWANYMLIGNNQ